MFGARRRFRTMLLLIAALIGAGLGVLAYETDAFESLDLNTVDTRFSIRGDEKPPDNIVVVGVDAKAFQTLNERWPFTHDEHAKVLKNINRDGAKVVGFDIQFSEPSDTDAQTFALLDAFYRAKNVVLSSTEVDDYGNGNAIVGYYPPPRRIERSTKPHALMDWLRKEVHVEVGNGNLPTDPGGVIRRVEYASQNLKAFSVKVAEKAGARVDPSDFQDGSAYIDYDGPPDTIKYVSYGDVWAGRTKPGTFRNKIVIVGATAPSLQDIHPSSTSGNGQMSGPEIQANAVETALRGYPLRDSPTGLDLLLIVLLGVVAPAATLVMPAVRAFLLAVLIGAGYVVATQLAFNGGTILPVVYPLGALALSAVLALAVYAVTEAFERQRTREIFGRFVPNSVVGQVLEQAEGLRLGGVARDATVMFSDLRGFTSFAESLEPDQVIRILNRYLTAMVDDAILPHGGTLVDYMGDGIMAVFGAPIEMDDHADRALAAARDKLVELEKFNEWLKAEMGFEKSFQMGIGLNSGRVMSGNVGSEQRLAYTAIGDTTNTAARLEAMTKNTPYMILLADSTRAELSDEPDDVVFVEEMEVRGRQQKVKLWSVGQSVKDGQSGTFQSISSDAAAAKAPAPAEEAPPEPTPEAPAPEPATEAPPQA